MDRVSLGISRTPLARALNTLARDFSPHSDLVRGGEGRGGVLLSQLTVVVEETQKVSIMIGVCHRDG